MLVQLNHSSIRFFNAQQSVFVMVCACVCVCLFTFSFCTAGGNASLAVCQQRGGATGCALIRIWLSWGDWQAPDCLLERSALEHLAIKWHW